MNRDEFEKAYAKKHTNGDFVAVFGNRDFDGYCDPHIDLWHKIYIGQAIKDDRLRLAYFDSLVI